MSNKIIFAKVGADRPYENGNMVICNCNDKTIVIDMNKLKMDNGTEVSSYEILKKHARKESDIPTIDLLVISHYDNDHIGDFAETEKIINAGKLKVKHIAISPYDPINENDFKESDHPDYQALKRVMKKVPTTKLYAGDKLSKTFPEIFSGIDFTVLNPRKNDELNDSNDAALVLLLEFGSKTFLLTSDIDKNTWYRIENKHKELLSHKINYMIIAHHGSITFFEESIASAEDKKPEQMENYKALNVIGADRFILQARTKFPQRDEENDNPPHNSTYKVFSHWIKKNKGISNPDSIIHYTADGDIIINVSDSHKSISISHSIRPYQGGV